LGVAGASVATGRGGSGGAGSTGPGGTSPAIGGASGTSPGVAGVAGTSPGTGGAGPGGGGGAGGSGRTISANLAINAAHDGTQPDEAIRSPLAKRWSVNIAGAVLYPLIANGRVYLSYADGKPKLAAYDLETGAVSWGPLTLATTVSLAYDAGNLFGLDQNGILSAWDGATGRALWTVALTKQWSFNDPPVASGGLVYVNGLGSGGTVYAIDGAIGTVRWTTDYYGGEGAVTIGDGILYEVSGCQMVSAMDAVTGQHLKVIHSTSCMGGGGGMAVYHQSRLWVIDHVLGNIIIDANGAVVGPSPGGNPAVHGGTAFYSAGGVSAYDLPTGTKKWSTPVDGLCTTPIVAGRGGQVFVGTVSGVLHELDEATGAEVSTDVTGFLSFMNCWPMALAEGRLAYATGTGLAVY
jgi:outer membrane protein assembly factor BamB